MLKYSKMTYYLTNFSIFVNSVLLHVAEHFLLRVEVGNQEMWFFDNVLSWV